MDIIFGIQNLSLYRADFLMTVLEKLSKYKLDLMGVQKSDGIEVPNQQRNVQFSIERGI
jgi:hypothetical protein